MFPKVLRFLRVPWGISECVCVYMCVFVYVHVYLCLWRQLCVSTCLGMLCMQLGVCRYLCLVCSCVITTRLFISLMKSSVYDVHLRVGKDVGISTWGPLGLMSTGLMF